MSPGVIPPVLICNYCRRTIFGADAQFYEGMHFHDYCISPYLARQEAEYEKKRRLGKITLAESMEHQDIRSVNEKVRKEPTHPVLEGAFFPDMARFKGNSHLSLESIRIESIQANEERKRLGMDRKEYYKLLSDREYKIKMKYLPHESKHQMLAGVAGDITVCKICGNRTFCVDDVCSGCHEGLKYKQLYSSSSGGV